MRLPIPSAPVAAGRRRLVLPWSLAAQLTAHARAAAPEEACGVLGGTVAGGQGEVEARVATVIPLPNSSPGDRRRRFEIAAAAILGARRALAARGLGIVGFYHSHPRGPAAASAADREGAWPEASCLLAARDRAGGWTLRGFRFPSGGEAVEEEVRIVAAGGREAVS